jgi:hypothetical protein
VVGQDPVQFAVRPHRDLAHADGVELLHGHIRAVHRLVVMPPGVVGHHLVDDALDQVAVAVGVAECCGVIVAAGECVAVGVAAAVAVRVAVEVGRVWLTIVKASREATGNASSKGEMRYSIDG